MNELVMLAAINIVLWIATFALLFTMIGRQKSMEEKFNALEHRMQNNTESQTE
jgi:hypothetical protein